MNANKSDDGEKVAEKNIEPYNRVADKPSNTDAATLPVHVRVGGRVLRETAQLCNIKCNQHFPPSAR